MPKQLTEYNLLFSCPGDAYKTCFSVIRESIADFNSYAKTSLGLSVNLTHWSTDSYPQSGGHPQALLNTQIVDNADAAIAVFWTRFGTPTDEFGSGTEEEIERLLSDKKQVFLYFLDKAIPPSMTDASEYREQRDQILLFRKKYEEKGIFCVASDEAALKEQFSRHLFLYFASQIPQDTMTPIAHEKSDLIVTSVDGKAETHIEHLNVTSEMDVESQRKLILAKLEDIRAIVLPPKISQTSAEKASTAADQIYGKQLASKDVKINEKDRIVVLDFCKENEILIEDDFWHLGTLKIDTSMIPMPLFGLPNEPTLIGSNDEKQKYNLMQELIVEIYHYNDRKQYCVAMDMIPFIEIIVQNKGTAFDEDIEIKLSMLSGSLLSAQEFPIPIIDLEMINEEDKLRNWICPKTTIDISEFDTMTAVDFSLPYEPYIPILPLQRRDYEAEIRKAKKEYTGSLEHFFDWEVFKSQDVDTIKINISKLNQYKAMHLPARLFFRIVPEKIRYTITAKFAPRIIEGEIIVCP